MSQRVDFCREKPEERLNIVRMRRDGSDRISRIEFARAKIAVSSLSLTLNGSTLLARGLRAGPR